MTTPLVQRIRERAKRAEFESGGTVPASYLIAIAKELEAEALAARAEPVAWIAPSSLDRLKNGWSTTVYGPAWMERERPILSEAIALYTTPPRAGGGEVREWRPIDSAPMDGTEIDVWCPETGKEWGYRVADAYWCAASGKWHVNGESWLTWKNAPTHWQHKPNGPTALHGAGVRGGE
jgi:hypothetical protein